MTRAFVVDASVAIAWVHPGQASAESDRMLEAVAAGSVLEVPAIWPLEVANALIVLARRGKLTARERDAGLGWIRRLPVRLDHDAATSALTTLAGLAASYQLSVYDAAYLELADRRKLALGCKDGPLRKAAVRHGVPLWR